MLVTAACRITDIETDIARVDTVKMLRTFQRLTLSYPWARYCVDSTLVALNDRPFRKMCKQRNIRQQRASRSQSIERTEKGNRGTANGK